MPSAAPSALAWLTRRVGLQPSLPGFSVGATWFRHHFTLLPSSASVSSPLPFLPHSVGTAVSSLILLSSPSAPASVPRLVVSLPVLGAPTPASLPKSGSSWTHLLGQGLDRRPLVGTERTDLIRVDFDPTSTQRLRPFWRHRTSTPFQSHTRALQVAPVDHAPRALRITPAENARPQSGGFSTRALRETPVDHAAPLLRRLGRPVGRRFG